MVSFIKLLLIGSFMVFNNLKNSIFKDLLLQIHYFILDLSDSFGYCILYNYFIELFSSKTRMVGISFSTIGIFLSTPLYIYLGEYMNSKNYPEITCIVVFNIISLVVLSYMPETIHKKIN